MVEVERKNGEIVIIEKFQMTFTESTEKVWKEIDLFRPHLR